jgi:hypothetical protein
MEAATARVSGSLGSFEMHPLRRSQAAQVTEVQSAATFRSHAEKVGKQEGIAEITEDNSTAGIASHSGRRLQALPVLY